MVRLSFFVFVVLMLCLAQNGLASDLRPYDAVYNSKLKGFKVKVKRRLQVEGNTVTLSVDVKRFWVSVHESSALVFHDENLLYPATHVHKRRGTSHAHDKDLVFDWTGNTVIDLLKPEREPLPVERPSYDKLSYQPQMRLDLLHNPDLQHIEYSVTNGFRNRIYSFDRLSEEVLDTPLGKLNTIKFKRGGDDDDRQVFVWVAPDWEFLMVRIDQTKMPGGKVEQLVLKRASIAGQKVTGLTNDSAPVESP